MVVEIGRCGLPHILIKANAPSGTHGRYTSPPRQSQHAKTTANFENCGQDFKKNSYC